jgi:hypothetical protein
MLGPTTEGTIVAKPNTDAPAVDAAEQRLSAEVESIIANLPEGQRPETDDGRRALREFLRPSILYKGQYVVFHDSWRTDGGHKILVERKVLFTHREERAVREFLANLPERERIQVDYDLMN